MDKEMTKKIGDNLKRLRKDNNLFQKQIAELLGVSVNVVSNWEKGRTPVDADVCIKLAKYYDVSINEILPTEKSEAKKLDKFKKYLNEYDPRNIHQRYYSLNEDHQENVDSIISKLKSIENRIKEVDEIYLAAASGSEGLTREDLEEDIQMVKNLGKQD